MVKTITIMDDAYELLKGKKEQDESFSDTIRRLCQKSAFDIKKMVGILPQERSLEELQRIIKESRKQADTNYQKRKQLLQPK
ncbi:MAG TPA: antitoxin VapB family protein [Candidatus Nanoarchaeia archaeon]|nr:antitoxin VapB family protein [Candidatus Nanoarchaeia archaeon]